MLYYNRTDVSERINVNKREIGYNIRNSNKSFFHG